MRWGRSDSNSLTCCAEVMPSSLARRRRAPKGARKEPGHRTERCDAERRRARGRSRAIEPSATLTNNMTDHLWLHFARHGPDITAPIITRGEGVTIFDDRGKSYLDGL